MVLLAKFFYFVRPVAKNLKKKKKRKKKLGWLSHQMDQSPDSWAV